MAIIQIPASYSLTVSNRNKRRNKREKIMFVGNKHKSIFYSYLYFDLNAVPNGIPLKSATLLLFKVADFFCCPLVKFSVCPSVKQLCSFSGFEADLSVESAPKTEFLPFTREAAIEIDITAVVNKWLNNELANRGLVIKSNNYSPYLSCVTAFGSAFSKDASLKPFIKLELKQGSYICLLPNSDITYTARVLPRRV